MMRGPVSDLSKLIAVGGIVAGLFFLMIGAVLADLGNANVVNETQEAQAQRENMRDVYGPLVAHIGAFFFVAGLFFAAFFWEAGDPFVRMFLLILGVVTLLLVLASSPTLFG